MARIIVITVIIATTQYYKIIGSTVTIVAREISHKSHTTW